VELRYEPSERPLPRKRRCVAHTRRMVSLLGLSLLIVLASSCTRYRDATLTPQTTSS
jgi:hypothetical protein